MSYLAENKKILFFLWLGIVVYSLVFTLLQILKYRSFFAFCWEDVATYNQIAFNTAKGIPFYCSIWNTVFYYHFSLIYLFIAPFYKLYSHIYTLFFSLSFAFGLGALGIYLIAKKIFKSPWMGLCFAYCYLLFPPLHFINFVDFRPIMFSIPLLIFLFYFYINKKFIYFFIFSLLVLSCKENLAFIIIMFGIFSVFKKRNPSWIVIPIVTGVLWFVLAVKVILPSVGYSRYEPLWKYIGGQSYSFSQLLITIFAKPFNSLRVMFSHGHLPYLLRIFNPPIYLLAFLSPRVLFLSLPTFLEVLFQDKGSQLHFESSHYICAIVVFSFIATIYACKKIFYMIDKANIKKLKGILLGLLVGWTIIGNFGDNMISKRNFQEGRDVADLRFLNIRNIFNPVFYRLDQDDITAWRLINNIPVNASVAASGDLLPALSSRNKLYEFGLSKLADRDFLYYLPLGWGEDADYIILRKYSIYHGAGSNEVDNLTALSEARDLVAIGKYETVEETKFFLLLKKKK